jgi:anti-sigma B factor antagonist
MNEQRRPPEAGSGSGRSTVLIRFNPNFGGGQVTLSRLEAVGNETEILRVVAGGHPEHKFPDVSDSIRNEIGTGNLRFIVDLESAHWLDSQALGYLIEVSTTITRAGGYLVFVHLSDRLKTLFNLTRIDEIFRCFDSIGEAVGFLGARSLSGGEA